MRRLQAIIIICFVLVALCISFVAKREKTKPKPRIQMPSISEIDLEGAA